MSVRIPPDNEKSNLIRIEGDPQGVQEAKKELLELASRMVSLAPQNSPQSGVLVNAFIIKNEQWAQVLHLFIHFKVMNAQS